MKMIELNQGYVVLLDDEDYPSILDRKWYAYTDKRNTYAARREYVGGKRSTISMHRYILGLKKGDGRVVDHINHNGLDNRRENLRIFPSGSRGNAANKRRYLGSTSEYLGVTWDKDRRKWRGQIQYGSRPLGQHTYLGLFDREEDAARAYDQAACDIFGIAANLNFREFI